MGCICFDKRRKVIFYIPSIQTPHRSVLQRGINCLSRENENHSFLKIWTLICKTPIKVTLFMKTWNDPTVITVILPQTIWLQTPIKVQFLTKVLKVKSSKSLGLISGTTFDDFPQFLRQFRWKINPDWTGMDPGTQKLITRRRRRRIEY